MTSEQLERQIRQQPRMCMNKVIRLIDDALASCVLREQALDPAVLSWPWGDLWPVEAPLRLLAEYLHETQVPIENQVWPQAMEDYDG